MGVKFLPLGKQELTENNANYGVLTEYEVGDFHPYSVPSAWYKGSYSSHILHSNNLTPEQAVKQQEYFEFVDTILKGLFLTEYCKNFSSFRIEYDIKLIRSEATEMITTGKPGGVDEIYCVKYGNLTLAISYPETLFFPTKICMDQEGRFQEFWLKMKKEIGHNFKNFLKNRCLHPSCSPHRELAIIPGELSNEQENCITQASPVGLLCVDNSHGHTDCIQISTIATLESSFYAKIPGNNGKHVRVCFADITPNQKSVFKNSEDRTKYKSIDNYKSLFESWQNEGLYIFENGLVDSHQQYEIHYFHNENNATSVADEVFRKTDSATSKVVQIQYQGEMIKIQIDKYWDIALIELEMIEKVMVLNSGSEQHMDSYSFPAYPFKSMNSAFRQIQTTWSELNESGVICTLCLYSNNDTEIFSFSKKYTMDDLLIADTTCKENMNEEKIDARDDLNTEPSRSISPVDLVHQTGISLWPSFWADDWDWYSMTTALPFHLFDEHKTEHGLSEQDNLLKIFDGADELSFEQKFSHFKEYENRRIWLNREDVWSFPLPDGTASGFFSLKTILNGQELMEKGRDEVVKNLSLDLGTTGTCLSYVDEGNPTNTELLNPSVPSIILNAFKPLSSEEQRGNERGGNSNDSNAQWPPVLEQDGIISTRIFGQNGNAKRCYEYRHGDLFSQGKNDFLRFNHSKKVDSDDGTFPGKLETLTRLKWIKTTDHLFFRNEFLKRIFIISAAQLRLEGFGRIKQINFSYPLAFSRKQVTDFSGFIEKGILPILKQAGIKTELTLNNDEGKNDTIETQIKYLSENEAFLNLHAENGQSIFVTLDMGGGTIDISAFKLDSSNSDHPPQMVPLLVDSICIAGEIAGKWLLRYYGKGVGPVNHSNPWHLIIDPEPNKKKEEKKNEEEKQKALEQLYLKLNEAYDVTLETIAKRRGDGKDKFKLLDINNPIPTRFLTIIKEFVLFNLKCTDSSLKEDHIQFNLVGRGWGLFSNKLLKATFGTEFAPTSTSKSQLSINLANLLGEPNEEATIPPEGIKGFCGIDFVTQKKSVLPEREPVNSQKVIKGDLMHPACHVNMKDNFFKQLLQNSQSQDALQFLRDLLTYKPGLKLKFNNYCFGNGIGCGAENGGYLIKSPLTFFIEKLHPNWYDTHKLLQHQQAEFAVQQSHGTNAAQPKNTGYSTQAKQPKQAATAPVQKQLEEPKGRPSLENYLTQEKKPVALFEKSEEKDTVQSLGQENVFQTPLELLQGIKDFNTETYFQYYRTLGCFQLYHFTHESSDLKSLEEYPLQEYDYYCFELNSDFSLPVTYLNVSHHKGPLFKPFSIDQNPDGEEEQPQPALVIVEPDLFSLNTLKQAGKEGEGALETTITQLIEHACLVVPGRVKVKAQGSGK